MTPTDRTLDGLLKLVRDNPPAEPLLAPEALENRLSQVDQGTGDLARRKPVAQPTWSIVMGIIALIIIGATLFRSGAADNTTTQIAAASSSSPRVSAATESGGATTAATQPAGAPAEHRGAAYSSYQPYPSYETDNPHGTPTPPTPAMPGLIIDDLTPQELKRMGIVFRDGRIVIEQTEPVPTSSVPSTERELCRTLGYDLTAPIIPFRVRTTFSLHLGEQERTAIPLAPSNDAVAIAPVATTMFDASGSSRALTGGGAAEELLGGGGMALLGREIGKLRNETTPSFDLLEQFVAVKMTYTAKETDGTERKREVYLWYLPTDDLHDALPARHRDGRFAERLSALRAAAATAPPASMKDMPFPGLIVIKQSDDYGSLWEFDRTRDIDGIRMFELTEHELERIGINRSGAGYDFGLCQRMTGDARDSWSGLLDSLGYGDETAPALTFSCSVDTFSFNYHPVAKGPFMPGSPLPVLFSSRWIYGPNDGADYTNGLSMIFTTDAPDLDSLRGGSDGLRENIDGLYKIDENDQSVASTALNGLVPVRVMLKSDEYVDSAGEYRGAEILFWFVPTHAFVEALPQRYAAPLRAELDAIASVERDGLPPSEICNRIAGERPYLDLCRSAAGAVTASAVYPNPANAGDDVTVSYRLSEPRTVTIGLHDLSGRFLKELAPPVDAPAGESTTTVSLDGVGGGTYLIGVEAGEGETAVQRVVVR